MNPQLHSGGETVRAEQSHTRTGTTGCVAPELDCPAERERLLSPRGALQTIYDLVGAPLRMVALPDAWSNRLGLTSLEDERLRAVLPELHGRVLDVGAGNNRLIRLHGDGVGVEVVTGAAVQWWLTTRGPCPFRMSRSTS